MKIPIEISARHVHLCHKDVEKLFGKNYLLKPWKKLSQAAEFAAQEAVILQNGQNTIKNVRVVGPERSATQVEISYTEARRLGVKSVLRLSGDINNTPGIILIGPKGKVILTRGVIIAKRHLHISYSQAKKLNFKQNQKIKVKIKGSRAMIFDEVMVRIAPDYKLRMHIDTDEGNAAGINKKDFMGELLK